jgi:hypothetical protein
MVRDDGDQMAKAEEEMIWTILSVLVAVMIYYVYRFMEYLGDD